MDAWRRIVERLRRHVALADYYLAFVLLNVADLFFTGVYFRMGGHEANRFAAWIIALFGLRGLVVIKFLLATLVVGICETLHPRRPALARSLILLGCAVYALVVLLQVWGLVARAG